MAKSKRYLPPLLLLNRCYLAAELEALGHRIFTAGPTNSPSGDTFDLYYDPGTSIEELLALIPQPFFPERILYYDDSSPLPTVLGIERSTLPTVFHSIDAHIHHTWHPIVSSIFDKVLVSQKDYITHFGAYNKDVTWFPNWAPINVEPADSKAIDVCFRGSLDASMRPERVEFLNALSQSISIDKSWGPYAAPFSSSKIIINETLKGDLNFRVFEAMMCGGMLLTPEIGNGQQELFIPGKHFVTYQERNVQQAAEKIRYYLANEGERAAIANSGREEILRAHTAQKRASQLSEMLAPLSVSERGLRYYGAGYLDFVISKLCRELVCFYNDRVFSGLSNLTNSALNREQLDDTYACAVAGLKAFADQSGLSHATVPYLEQIHNSYPEHPILAISLVDALVKAGETERATTLGKSFLPEAQDLVSQVDYLFQVIAKHPVISERRMSVQSAPS